jgi:hypothetical protein
MRRVAHTKVFLHERLKNSVARFPAAMLVLHKARLFLICDLRLHLRV